MKNSKWLQIVLPAALLANTCIGICGIYCTDKELKSRRGKKDK